MKCIYVLCLVAVVAVTGDEMYTTENDNLDIDAVVKDPISLQNFSSCFLDKSVCDPVPAAFKEDIADAVKTSCAKCTPAQKHIFKKFLEGLKKNLRQDYAAFQKKYDPEAKHFTELEAAVASS